MELAYTASLSLGIWAGVAHEIKSLSAHQITMMKFNRGFILQTRQGESPDSIILGR